MQSPSKVEEDEEAWRRMTMVQMGSAKVEEDVEAWRRMKMVEDEEDAEANLRHVLAVVMAMDATDEAVEQEMAEAEAMIAEAEAEAEAAEREAEEEEALMTAEAEELFDDAAEALAENAAMEAEFAAIKMRVEEMDRQAALAAKEAEEAAKVATAAMVAAVVARAEEAAATRAVTVAASRASAAERAEEAIVRLIARHDEMAAIAAATETGSAPTVSDDDLPTTPMVCVEEATVAEEATDNDDTEPESPVTYLALAPMPERAPAAFLAPAAFTEAAAAVAEAAVAVAAAAVASMPEPEAEVEEEEAGEEPFVPGPCLRELSRLSSRRPQRRRRLSPLLAVCLRRPRLPSRCRMATRRS